MNTDYDYQETTRTKHMDLSQKIIDTVTGAGYDRCDPDELCPDAKVKLYFGGQDKPCRNVRTGRCVLLDHIWQYQCEKIDKQFELGFNICSDEPFDIENMTPGAIGCEMRVKLLELYDKYQANGKSTDAHRNFSNAIKQAGSGCLTSLSGEDDFFESQMGKTPYSDKAMEEAYEKWQYEKRKSCGEPVIFHNGRCLFDQALFWKGIQPGPFPGLDFYMYDKKLLTPEWVREWLDSNEFATRKNRLPAVGYYGRALCAVHFSDIFQYYVLRYSIYGPETFRKYIRRYSSWAYELIYQIC